MKEAAIPYVIPITHVTSSLPSCVCTMMTHCLLPGLLKRKVAPSTFKPFTLM